ncbi:MAG: hypothetical protein M1587_01240, partial [Thaumarchaeota archaeon]|nr:hypothetical protein [Nitrososphaerota archaeon]
MAQFVPLSCAHIGCGATTQNARTTCFSIAIASSCNSCNECGFSLEEPKGVPPGEGVDCVYLSIQNE